MFNVTIDTNATLLLGVQRVNQVERANLENECTSSSSERLGAL